MFLSNKYTNWYNSIIERAKNRKLNGYFERHHIIPKSLGGSDYKENIVDLTGKEHFICHLLLTKMLLGDNKYKMIKAANMMAFRHSPNQERYKINSRTYGILKKSIEIPLNVRLKMGESQKNRFKNISGTFLGKSHTEKTRKKMSESASKPKSEKWKISASKNRTGKPAPNKGIPHTAEAKKKISQAMLGEKNPFFGKTHSEEQRQKKREEKLAAPKKLCYHCGKEVDPMNYARWHGDKCKQRK